MITTANHIQVHAAGHSLGAASSSPAASSSTDTSPGGEAEQLRWRPTILRGRVSSQRHSVPALETTYPRTS